MSSSEYRKQHNTFSESHKANDEAREARRDHSGWIRKYLDLADVAMSRGEDSSNE